MKYALIVMLAVYLVTFGCNPKTEEEKTASHDKMEHATSTEAPANPGELTVETHTLEQSTPEAGPANKYGTAHKTPAAPADVEITTETVKTEATPAAKEESTTEEVDTKANQWKSIAQSAAVTVLALMHDDQSNTTTEVVETPAVEKETVKPTTSSEALTVLPCGKKVSQEVAARHKACAKHSKNAAQQATVPAEEPELSEAMQKMVNATNDMVTVTRQLVIATQQMLAASKEVAVEVIDSGKDALESAKPAVQNAVNEKEIIETVKEVVSATKEAFEATSEALSEALEAKEAQPAQAATPQQ